VCVRARTCVHARMCVHARRCVFMCVRAHVKGMRPSLGPSSPMRASLLPSCLSTLGALRGGLKDFPGLSPFMLIYK